jgi:cytochrome P450
VTILAGTPVLAGYASAGRDQRVYGEDADSFDVTRDVGQHLSSATARTSVSERPLARLEVAIVLERLLTRFPHLDLAFPTAPSRTSRARFPRQLAFQCSS